MAIAEIEGQMNAEERALLTAAIRNAPAPPKNAVEVGTWLGGGSTLHILRAMAANGTGHLWGIEADRSIYDRMITNIRQAVPEAADRFTPLFGFSQEILPAWLREQPSDFQVDFAFLDGGNRPMEQITEFELLDPYIPVGGQLMAHDAKLRKGKWLVPFLSALDNWETRLHDVSEEGLFYACKRAVEPSPKSLKEARNRLRRLRLKPAEVAAVILPAPVRKVVAGCLPRRWIRSLAEGRR